jgi:hypothetical protein
MTPEAGTAEAEAKDHEDTARSATRQGVCIAEWVTLRTGHLLLVKKLLSFDLQFFCALNLYFAV